MSTAPLCQASRRSLTPDQMAQYNRTGMQRDRIIEALRTAGEVGLTVAELQRYSPSVTKRISELRKRGAPIRTEFVAIAGADSRINTVARYVLGAAPVSQHDLFSLLGEG